jgi:hypothetical protein
MQEHDGGNFSKPDVDDPYMSIRSFPKQTAERKCITCRMPQQPGTTGSNYSANA